MNRNRMKSNGVKIEIQLLSNVFFFLSTSDMVINVPKITASSS